MGRSLELLRQLVAIPSVNPMGRGLTGPEFLEARRITSRIEAGETDDPTELAGAITGYRNLYEFLLEEEGPR